MYWQNRWKVHILDFLCWVNYCKNMVVAKTIGRVNFISFITPHGATNKSASVTILRFCNTAFIYRW